MCNDFFKLTAQLCPLNPRSLQSKTGPLISIVVQNLISITLNKTYFPALTFKLQGK